MKKNKKPYHVIQLFNNSYVYDKDYKNYESRKEVVQWKNEIPSNSLVDGKVQITNVDPAISLASDQNMVILIDHNINTFEELHQLHKLNNENWDKQNANDFLIKRPKLFLGKLAQHKLSFEIFQLRLKETKLELFIDWDYWKVGREEKENFKIGELKIHQPLNIKIDGKRDFSLTGRRKRTFIENNYIIEYKGIFEEVEFIKEQKTFTKLVPVNSKEINFMKHLK
ncbi:hypothetical protein [Flammeovirga pacifica]|uniref:Uncharacterized protein n=1 Tax=Flammeovirga pacifica TaxID=915059 RepID=A0A1S1YSH1_FLAPC|nr:hypothetical protein [Flammeovirga pacifica]OHX63970.1 hypothetical protein NH26_20380 [Flammeovirga pacifica]